MQTTVVSVNWLYKHLDDEQLVILDVSPKSNVSGLETAFDNQMIPQARFVDLKKDFVDQTSVFPNTIPSATQFEKACQKLGINRDSQIVIYDNLGIYTSPRLWYLFKVMGHEKVAVLDGGLPEWIKQGQETIEKEIKAYPKGNFKAVFQKEGVRYYEQVLENVSVQKSLVIDARSSGRFNGTAEEPRKHLKSGHIPNSINIPFKEVLEDGKFKNKEALKKIFAHEAIQDQPLIFSCGSGLTACIVSLASALVLENEKTIYDGSWTEWAELQNLKK